MASVGGTPRRIVFFFPYRPISGAPVLFARMARALDARGVRCGVVDYADGCLSSLVADCPSIERVAFVDGQPLTIPDDALLVMQAMLPATIWTELSTAPGTPVLFWSLHAMNFVQTVLPFERARHWQAQSLTMQRAANRTVLRGFRKELAAFVTALDRAGSLAFMDGSTWEAARLRLEIDLPRPRFVPVVIDVPDDNPRVAPPPEPFVASWLGRLDDFKVPILNHTITTLGRVARASGRPMTLEIIGDGPLAGRLAPAAEPLSVVRRGTLAGPALAAALSRAHLHFAMGTSALEGARLGVPTVLLDFAYGPVHDEYVFEWLTAAKDFALGRQITPADGAVPDGSARSLTAIVDAVDRDPMGRSAAAHAYCRDWHSIDTGADAFLAAAAAASYRFSDIPAALKRKGVLRRVYEQWR